MATLKNKHKVSDKQIQEYRGQLLNWYDAHAREIPWRVKSGHAPDPYKIWLSEIMCQQTTVQAVKGYYMKFLSLWPSIHDLAKADNEDVMAAWAGLGYYARARNLHKCAKIVANDLNGNFPDTQAGLKELPGIGEYTSAAITAIAFNKPATVVDGNVERVISRFFAIEDPLPHSKKHLKELAALFFSNYTARPGDLAQSFMDLGAGICIPKAPRCVLCPLKENCQGLKKGIAAELPRKIKKSARPQKYGHIYWIENKDGEVLFHKRPEKGLLGGMAALPTTNWSTEKMEPCSSFNIKKSLKQRVHHTFTHFDLELHLHHAKISTALEDDYFWDKPSNQSEALPSVFKKAYNLFIKVA
jgi:A/G-specific adenine glycosylase